MRYAVSFFIGFVIGALSLLLTLQMRGRLRDPEQAQAPAPASPPDSSSLEHPRIYAEDLPGRTSLPIEPRGMPQPTPTPTRASATPLLSPAPAAVNESAVNDDSLIALPVVGVRKSDLKDHFNDRRGGSRIHEAIDIMAARGTPVVASVDGRISKLFLSNAGGITIYQTDVSGALMYYYAHLESYAPNLVEGRSVRRGQVIGFVGSTGNANPAGPHLHFGIARLPADRKWWKGKPVNPYPMLMQRGMETVAVKR